MTWIEIDADDWHFNVRVAAVVIHADHILLQRAIDGDFWHLSGGRVQPLETSEAALIRTIGWELREAITIERLLWTTEYITTIAGRYAHQIGFYYLVILPDGNPYLDLARDHAGVERGHPLTLRWFPLTGVSSLMLYPDFLRTGLQHIPDTPQHLIITVPRPLV